MYIPKKLNIRGTDWVVKMVDQPVGEDGEPTNGTCCNMQKEIEIKKDLPKDLILEIFLHEWVHAVWFESGVEEELPDKYAWIEHIVIAGISKELVARRKVFQKILASCKKAA